MMLSLVTPIHRGDNRYLVCTDEKKNKRGQLVYETSVFLCLSDGENYLTKPRYTKICGLWAAAMDTHVRAVSGYGGSAFLPNVM